MSDPDKGKPQKPEYRSATAIPVRPDRTLLAIGLLAIAVLAGSIAMLPSPEEKAAGLMAEGRYDDAIQILVSLEDERSLNAYEGYTLFKLYMLTRAPRSAVALIDSQPALQADNAWALRQISDLFRQVRDLPGEADVLRRLYDVNPNDADFSRLRILYRLLGDRAREASLLEQAIIAGRSDPSLLDRLAYLKSGNDWGVEAAVWVAPTGQYFELVNTPPLRILALAGPVIPVNTQPE